jgi:hypothetical protein
METQKKVSKYFIDIYIVEKMLLLNMMKKVIQAIQFRKKKERKDHHGKFELQNYSDFRFSK